MTPSTAPLRTIAWLAGLAAALSGLVRAGDHLTPPPWPVPDASATWRWIEQTDPALTTFSLIRVVAIVAVTSLLVSTSVLVVGQVLRLPALVAAADRLTMPAARRLIHHAVGAGLAVTLASATVTAVATFGPLPAATAAPFLPTGPLARGDGSSGTTPGTALSAPPPVLRALPDEPVLVHLGPADPTPGLGLPRGGGGAVVGAGPSPSPSAGTGLDPTSGGGGGDGDVAVPSAPAEPDAPTPRPTDTGTGSGTGTDDRLAPAGSPTSRPATPTDATPTDGASTDATSTDAAATDLAAHHHTIVAGDHLWAVAEQTLATQWGRAPEPDEIATYLHRLIEANRPVLAVPGEPDLVFPGQVFALPDVPAP